MGVYQNVKEVDNIAGVVKRPPESRHGVVELPEYGTTNHEHEVVQYGYRDQREPLKMVKRSTSYKNVIILTWVSDSSSSEPVNLGETSVTDQLSILAVH
jgi:hypothetical protein